MNTPPTLFPAYLYRPSPSPARLRSATPSSTRTRAKTKVVLEWDYIMLCGYMKIFDLLVGLWLWIGLGWAWSDDRDYSERHSIKMLLVSITTVQTLTDVW